MTGAEGATPLVGGTGRIEYRPVEDFREAERSWAGKEALKQKIHNTLVAARYQADLDSWGPSLSRNELDEAGFHDIQKDILQKLVNDDYFFGGENTANAFTQFMEGPARTPYAFLSGLWDGCKEAGISGSPIESLSDLQDRINKRREEPERVANDLRKGYRPSAGLTEKGLTKYLTPLLDARDKSRDKLWDKRFDDILNYIKDLKDNYPVSGEAGPAPLTLDDLNKILEQREKEQKTLTPPSPTGYREPTKGREPTKEKATDDFGYNIPQTRDDLLEAYKDGASMVLSILEEQTPDKAVKYMGSLIGRHLESTDRIAKYMADVANSKGDIDINELLRKYDLVPEGYTQDKAVIQMNENWGKSTQSTERIAYGIFALVDALKTGEK